MKKFEIAVPDQDLEDLQARLARTRFPDQLAGAEWDYGTELEFLKGLVAYWRDDFDWRAQERQLNRFDHWKARVRTDQEDLSLHFIHQRSPEADAMPLVITHGWPGSIFEFHKIIGPLTDPVAHGGKREDAFHVVCPSMPGYGFSQAPTRPGFDIRQVAGTISRLMALLGYDRYGAQGGDWGAVGTSELGRIDSNHCCGIHINMVIAGPPEGVGNPMEGLTAQELRDVQDAAAFVAGETGYQQIQGTKPQTLGYGLTDSPAGLAAWIVEKFRSWSDCDGDVLARFSRDDLLTNIMIYWVTGSITSSTRLYCETMRSGRFGPVSEYVTVPTAAAIFPREIYRVPRSWAEKAYNIQRWTRFDAGGHFAALEQPQTLVEDVRAFFRTLR